MAKFLKKYSVIDTHQEVIIAVLPFFHIYGMVVILMGSLYVGAKIVTLPFFSPELYIKSLVTYKPTALYVVPPMGTNKIVLRMY